MALPVFDDETCRWLANAVEKHGSIHARSNGGDLSIICSFQGVDVDYARLIKLIGSKGPSGYKLHDFLRQVRGYVTDDLKRREIDLALDFPAFPPASRGEITEEIRRKRSEVSDALKALKIERRVDLCHYIPQDPHIEELQAINGIIFGDGCIRATSKGVKLKLNMAIKGLPCLEKIHNILKAGNISGPIDKGPSSQPQYELAIMGRQAQDVIRRLIDHMPPCRKRKEMVLALQYPFAAYRLTDEEKNTREFLFSRLREMKMEPDEEFTDELSIPFIGGLMASDGHIGLLRSRPGSAVYNPTVQFVQKHPAICQALRRQLGGNVYQRTTSYAWSKCITHDHRFRTIFRFAYGKEEQYDVAMFAHGRCTPTPQVDARFGWSPQDL